MLMFGQEFIFFTNRNLRIPAILYLNDDYPGIQSIFVPTNSRKLPEVLDLDDDWSRLGLPGAGSVHLADYPLGPLVQVLNIIFLVSYKIVQNFINIYLN